MNLQSQFLRNPNSVCHKWIHYIDIYEKHFSKYRDKPLLMFEIGVDNGGSLDMWKNYFGKSSTIVGIDINQNCKQYELPSENIFVEIGNQSDVKFLQSLIDKYGYPDILLDDGSHKMNDLIATFEFMYHKVKEGGVYFVEDLHTCFMPQYLDSDTTFIDYVHKYIKEMNMPCADILMGKKPSVSDFTLKTGCVSFYDSIIAFEKVTQGRRIDLKTGNINLF